MCDRVCCYHFRRSADTPSEFLMFPHALDWQGDSMLISDEFRRESLVVQATTFAIRGAKKATKIIGGWSNEFRQVPACLNLVINPIGRAAQSCVGRERGRLDWAFGRLRRDCAERTIAMPRKGLSGTRGHSSWIRGACHDGSSLWPGESDCSRGSTESKRRCGRALTPSGEADYARCL